MEKMGLFFDGFLCWVGFFQPVTPLTVADRSAWRGFFFSFRKKGVDWKVRARYLSKQAPEKLILLGLVHYQPYLPTLPTPYDMNPTSAVLRT